MTLERPEAREACRQGQEEMRAGRRRQAIEALRRGLSLDPGRADCRAALATLLLRELRWREAEAEFRAALERTEDPRHREVLLLGLGESLEGRGEIAVAAARYEEALRSNPDSPRALGHLALVRRRAGDLEGAVSAWKTYLEKNPKDSAAVERLEEVLRLLAEQSLLEKEARDPGAGAGVWDALARSRRAAADPEGEIAARGRAAALAPEDAGRAMALALALIGAGRTGEAAAELERALRLDPDRSAACAQLAALAERAKDRPAERRAWERLLERHPLDRVAMQRLVELDRLDGRLGEAEREAAERAAAEGAGAAPALRLALVRSAAGDATGAAEAFAVALERAPNQPAVQDALRDHLRATAGARPPGAKAGTGRRMRSPADPGAPEARGRGKRPAGPRPTPLGRALLDLHRAAAGADASGVPAGFADLASRHPARADLRTALGDALASAGRAEEARREYLRVLEIDPGEPFAELGLALLAIRAGETEEAERRSRSVLARRPRDPYALASLAMVLYRGGRMEEAAAAARAALEIDPWEQTTGARFLLARALAARGELRAAGEAARGEAPPAGWRIYDEAWEFARDTFLGERPPAFWEVWRRRPGELAGEEEAVARVAELLASLEERYTRLRTPGETIDRYFSRRPDSPALVAGRTSEANRAVIARRLGENLAYLRLADFQTPEIASVVRQILEELGDASGLVLDLRGNPGGLQDEARKVAEMLVPPGTPLEIEQRRDGTSTVQAGPGAGLFGDRRVVVLVDEETASAAESLASMLQAAGRATVLGDPTRGKGVSQALRLLPGGYSLLVTAGQSFDPAGRPLQGRGVEPQSAPAAGAPDPALERAREILAPPAAAPR